MSASDKLAEREVAFVRQADGVCSVCNPVRLADFETDVVVARTPLAVPTVQLCGRCITAFYVVMESQLKHATIELHEEVWAFARKT